MIANLFRQILQINQYQKKDKVTSQKRAEMNRSGQSNARQSKLSDNDNDLDEASRNNPNQVYFSECTPQNVHYNMDYGQFINKRSFVDCLSFADSLPSMLNSHQRQQFHNSQLQYEQFHNQAHHPQFNHPNRRQNFPQLIPHGSNYSRFPVQWSTGNPNDFTDQDQDVKKEQFCSENEDVDWKASSLQVKNQPLNDDISHYIYGGELQKLENFSPNNSQCYRPGEGQAILEYSLTNPQQGNITGLIASFENNLKQQKTQSVSLRRMKVLKYLQKKKNRDFSKKITYEVRKKVADKRIRRKGRFINPNQAISQLGLDHTQEYQISYLKELIKKSEENTNSITKEEASSRKLT